MVTGSAAARVLLAGAALGALALAGPAGCASIGDLKKVRKRVEELEQRQKELQGSLEEDVKRVEKLHDELSDKLEKAEKTLQKSRAGLSMRVDRLESKLPEFKGKLESVNFTVERLTKDVERLEEELYDRLGATSVYLPHEIPDTADELWELAQSKLDAGERRTARALLDRFEASYPDDERADDGLTMLGRLQAKAGETDRAIKTYQRVHETYGDGDRAPVALRRIVELLAGRGDCQRARKVRDYLGEEYGDSDAAQMPKAELLGSCAE